MSMQVPSTPAQAAMLRTWEAHLTAEFALHDLEATMATMTAEPSVLHIGTMTGGIGAGAVRRFYRESFLQAHPPDTATTVLGRVIGDTCIVDQVLYRCTHTIDMPWLLPGVPPTGKAFASVMVALIEFAGDKIAAERIFFDQAAILAQLGLLDAEHLPVVAREAADFLAGAAVAPNRLIDRARG
jgi:carboxymethylenebutenolidase